MKKIIEYGVWIPLIGFIFIDSYIGKDAANGLIAAVWQAGCIAVAMIMCCHK